MAGPVQVIDFSSSRNSFVTLLEGATLDGDIETVEKEFKLTIGSDGEKKLALDQAFKDVLMLQMKCCSDCDVYKKTITLATTCVVQELCTSSTPFMLMSDLLDCIPLEKCAEMFSYIEERVATWKVDLFYTSGKNYLLRMCNDLLRRMSQSQNTLFCGRIQMFLARLFPLSEKSGLNLMSVFNLENRTKYGSKAEDYQRLRSESLDGHKDEKMELEEGETDDQSIPVDYNLYKKFWSLQDFFRKPVQCYDKLKWKEFTNYTNAVLECFSSYKLDDLKTTEKKMNDVTKNQDEYFAKYLTSEKLLDLQLSDSSFRRYVLVQLLVLFQYLSATVKFKSANQALNDDQAAWAKKTTERVYVLLRETPPDGSKFAKAIEHTLSREEHWNAWKNQGCPSYVREKLEKKASLPSHPFHRKRPLGDDMKANEGKLIKMGSSELTRLWNLNRDNMAACRSESRDFVPKLEAFFEDAILQADPEQQVEEQYKLVNNETWSWKALRLLSRNSPHFFAPVPTNNAKKTMKEHLEEQLQKLKKDLPGYIPPSSSNEAQELEAESVEEVTTTEQVDENIDKPDEQAAGQSAQSTVTLDADQIERIAGSLGTNWKKIAPEFGFQEDEITFIESENDDVKEQGIKLLKLWMENEGEKATIPALRDAMKDTGLEAEFIDVFGSKDYS